MLSNLRSNLRRAMRRAVKRDSESAVESALEIAVNSPTKDDARRAVIAATRATASNAMTMTRMKKRTVLSPLLA